MIGTVRMRNNTLPIPAHIQAIADKFMADNHARFGGWTMTLGTEEAIIPGAPAVPPVATGDEVFTKADIEAAMEKAREQEKAKVYGRLESLQEKLSEIQSSEQERLAVEQAARQKAEDEVRQREEAELSAKELLARKEQEWQQQIEALRQDNEQRLTQFQQEREQERVLLEKEKQFASLQAYTQKRLGEEQNHIAPQLVDYINGNSPEEIEQSITSAKAKSAEIAEAARQALQAARSQQRGVSSTGYAPVGPLEVEGGSRQYSADDIQNMSASEYAKFRQSIPGIGGSTNNRGLFG